MIISLVYAFNSLIFFLIAIIWKWLIMRVERIIAEIFRVFLRIYFGFFNSLNLNLFYVCLIQDIF